VVRHTKVIVAAKADDSSIIYDHLYLLRTICDTTAAVAVLFFSSGERLSECQVEVFQLSNSGCIVTGSLCKNRFVDMGRREFVFLIDA
jgi:hypothetical protein